ncbi:hypothetical protein GIX45_25785 [Erwinia sp. CPCC 100877]|nr:hypothetical protein [Erwinia sp. CPCC 100877]
MNEQVPKEIPLYCWQLIDKKRSETETELDYLQIFERCSNSKKYFLKKEN